MRIEYCSRPGHEHASSASSVFADGICGFYYRSAGYQGATPRAHGSFLVAALKGDRAPRCFLAALPCAGMTCRSVEHLSGGDLLASHSTVLCPQHHAAGLGIVPLAEREAGWWRCRTRARVGGGCLDACRGNNRGVQTCNGLNTAWHHSLPM